MSIDTYTTTNSVLEKHAAEQLDKQIRDVTANAADRLDCLAHLLTQAKAGRIHQALQFDSWTAYLANRLKPITKALDADDRRALIAELYQEGMSVRAIADAVGTSKSSVSRQVSQSGTGEGQTTGMDGKSYRRDPNVIDLNTKRPDTEGGHRPKMSHHNGGRRGKWKSNDFADRAKSCVEHIDGDPELRTRIIGLIDELLASIEPKTESD